MILNVALITVIGAMLFRSVFSGSEPGQLKMAVEDAPSSVSISQLRAMYDTLISSGVEDDLAKRVLLAKVDAGHEDGTFQYWKISAISRSQMLLSAYERQRNIRQTIVSVFGESVKSDSAFGSIFQPYRATLPFLSNQKQIDLQEIIMNAEAIGIQSEGKLVGVRGVVNAESESAVRGEIRRLLSSDEFFEFEIRQSVRAQRLLATGFDFTEEEFRAAFRAASLNESVMVGPQREGSSDKSIQHLRKIFGERRFSEFIRFQNPSFRLLASITSRYQLGSDKLNAAYAIVLNADQEIVRKQGGDDVTSLAKRQELAELIRHRDSKLKDVLGKDALAEFSKKQNVLRRLPAMVAVPTVN